MNVENARWLRGYLEGLKQTPERFDYGQGFFANDCGCVAAHVKHVNQLATHGPRVLMDFLDISVTQAFRLFEAKRIHRGSRDFMSLSPYRLQGVHGINRAITILDEIAAAHSIKLNATAAPAFVPDDAAFLAKLRASIQQPVEAQ